LFYCGDDAPLGVFFAAGLMQEGVGSDEVKQRPEVSSEPYRHGRNKIGQYLGVGYRDAVLGTLQPDLEGMPGFEVRPSFACFYGQCRHNGTGLILSVGRGLD